MVVAVVAVVLLLCWFGDFVFVGGDFVFVGDDLLLVTMVLLLLLLFVGWSGAVAAVYCPFCFFLFYNFAVPSLLLFWFIKLFFPPKFSSDIT